MKPLIYPIGRYARDGIIADFLCCFGGPDREYLGLKEFKTKAFLFLQHLPTKCLLSLLFVLREILHQKLNRITSANLSQSYQAGMSLNELLVNPDANWYGKTLQCISGVHTLACTELSWGQQERDGPAWAANHQGQLLPSIHQQISKASCRI